MIVDIQHIRYPDHYHRFLYYHCAAMMEMIADLKSYEPDTKVFTLEQIAQATGLSLDEIRKLSEY